MVFMNSLRNGNGDECARLDTSSANRTAVGWARHADKSTRKPVIYIVKQWRAKKTRKGGHGEKRRESEGDEQRVCMQMSSSIGRVPNTLSPGCLLQSATFLPGLRFSDTKSLVWQATNCRSLFFFRLLLDHVQLAEHQRVHLFEERFTFKLWNSKSDVFTRWRFSIICRPNPNRLSHEITWFFRFQHWRRWICFWSEEQLIVVYAQWAELHYHPHFEHPQHSLVLPDKRFSALSCVHISITMMMMMVVVVVVVEMGMVRCWAVNASGLSNRKCRGSVGTVTRKAIAFRFIAITNAQCPLHTFTFIFIFFLFRFASIVYTAYPSYFVESCDIAIIIHRPPRNYGHSFTFVRIKLSSSSASFCISLASCNHRKSN